jgi:hypothetical protein
VRIDETMSIRRQGTIGGDAGVRPADFFRL